MLTPVRRSKYIKRVECSFLLLHFITIYHYHVSTLFLDNNTFIMYLKSSSIS